MGFFLEIGTPPKTIYIVFDPTHPLVTLINIEPYTFVTLFPGKVDAPHLRYVPFEWPDVGHVNNNSLNGSCLTWLTTSHQFTHQPVYSPAPAGMPIRLGRSGGSVRREQEAYVGL